MNMSYTSIILLMMICASGIDAESSASNATSESSVESAQSSGNGWLSWDAWTACTDTCGAAIRTRTRACADAPPSADCPEGGGIDAEMCELPTCPPLLEWNQWSVWSGCGATCGDSIRTRNRTCPGEEGECTGDASETETCNQGDCPEWGDWGPWTACLSSCGPGLKTRTRTCQGTGCEGTDITATTCNDGPCPEWYTWGPWSVCSVTCGDGLHVRMRNCSQPDLCSGACTETDICNLADCSEPHQPNDAGWSDWGPWGDCVSSGDKGEKTRTRTCTSDVCPGGPEAASQTKKCKVKKSKAGWSDWSAWSDCVLSGDKGEKTRTRTCNSDSPNECPGAETQTKSCKVKQSGDGKYGPWGKYTNCSVTCGGGVKTKTRECKAGKTCDDEKLVKTKKCNKKKC